MRLARSIVAVLALALAAPAGAADLVPLNIAVIPTDSAAQVFYAQDEGFFRDAGLDVHLSNMQSSSAIVSAMVGGGIDVGNATVGSAANARAHEIKVKFIAPAGLWVNTAPTAQLVTVKGSPLKKPADFVGKTIAVTGLGDLVYWAARAWLDGTGIDSAKAKYVELPEPEMVAALKQGRVDGAVLIEPFLSAASDQVAEVAPVDDYVAKRFLATGWLVTDAWLQAHPDIAARFAAVMQKTAEWANTHHKESAEILLRYTKLTPDVAAKMTRVTYGTTLDASLITPVIANAQKYNPFPTPVTAADIMWTNPRAGAAAAH
jgi:NitT/TauT family transport system substrate-binding protein